MKKNAKIRIDDVAHCKDEAEVDLFVRGYFKQEKLKRGTIEAVRARGLILTVWKNRGLDKEPEKEESAENVERRNVWRDRRRKRGQSWIDCEEFGEEDFEMV